MQEQRLSVLYFGNQGDLTFLYFMEIVNLWKSLVHKSCRLSIDFTRSDNVYLFRDDLPVHSLENSPQDLVVINLNEFRPLDFTKVVERVLQKWSVEKVMFIGIGENAGFLTKQQRGYFEAKKIRFLHEPFLAKDMVSAVSSIVICKENVSTLKIADLEFDLQKERCYQKGKPLALNRQQYTLLLYFATHPAQFFTRGELLDALVKTRRKKEPNKKIVDTLVSQLRRLLEPIPKGKRARKRGYSSYFHFDPVSGYKFEPKG